MFRSRYMPCEDCGASVDRHNSSLHECSPERLSDYRMFELRHDVAQLEPGVLLDVRSRAAAAEGPRRTWLTAGRPSESVWS